MLQSLLNEIFLATSPLRFRRYIALLLTLIIIFGFITYLAFLGVDLLAMLIPGFDETRWNIAIDIFFTIGGFYFATALTLRAFRKSIDRGI